VIVTQGYIGATDQGVSTTLGRGGSDWSALALRRALAADEVQIWTDVEGVFTADPRVVPTARPIAELSFARGERTRRVRSEGAAPRDDPARRRAAHPGDGAPHAPAARALHDDPRPGAKRPPGDRARQPLAGDGC
jgi:hypothetical protein